MREKCTIHTFAREKNSHGGTARLSFCSFNYHIHLYILAVRTYFPLSIGGMYDVFALYVTLLRRAILDVIHKE